MAIFTKDSLENLRQKVDLVDLLSSHMELKKSGASYKGLCPFHDEKSPSFMVQKGDKYYHCFGCGAHGDAISFLMTHLRLSFTEAVESLAEKFHITLDKIEEGENKEGPSKSQVKEAMQQALRLYHYYLLYTPEGHIALQYLYERGLDIDFIKRFEIGLAPKAYGFLRKILNAKFISDEILIAGGLLSQNTDGQKRDFFSDRITFPIKDVMGNCIGFSARKYKEETFGGKYVNTSETLLFKKSKVLFGLNYSRKKIAKDGVAIVVEGQIDALKLIQEGFDFTVAGQGTAFGENHAKELISLGVNKVYLALDADLAGLTACSKIGEFFQKEGIEVQVVEMPSGSDPDSLIREQGKAAFQTLLEKSISYLDFMVKFLSKDLDLKSPAAKSQLVETLAKQIRGWNHPIMVHESLRKLAHLTQVSESTLTLEKSYTPNLYIKKSASIGLQSIDPHRILEMDLLRWLLLTPDGRNDFYTLAKNNLKSEDLSVSICQKMYAAFLHSVENEEPADAISLILKVDDPEAQIVITELHTKKINKEKAKEQFVDTIQKILNRNWMEKCEQIKIQIHSCQHTEEEALNLVKTYNELRKAPPAILN